MKYQAVKLVRVFYDDGTSLSLMGRLALKNRKIYFEYDQGFRSKGLELSPLKLPLRAGVIPCEDLVFGGLFGVFNDSLPDGWGRLLLDRHIRQSGILPDQLTALDRLTHVGNGGMGALRYEPSFSSCAYELDDLNLDQISAHAKDVLLNEAEDILGLLQLAGSSGGARPKALIKVNPKNHKLALNSHQDPQYEPWIIKFPASNDPKDIGAIEYAYSLMARKAGLDVPPTHLFPAKRGAGYFGVKRFDRDKEKKIHFHSVSGLLHADYRLPSLDYEAILRLTLTLTRDLQEVEKCFRLAVFNVLAHNRDDHAKNIGFTMNSEGVWSLSPAYDLTFSAGPGGEHSTSVMGEGKKPETTHLLHLAKEFQFSEKKAMRIIEEVSEAVAKWSLFGKQAGVTNKSVKWIEKALA